MTSVKVFRRNRRMDRHQRILKSRSTTVFLRFARSMSLRIRLTIFGHHLDIIKLTLFSHLNLHGILTSNLR